MAHLALGQQHEMPYQEHLALRRTLVILALACCLAAAPARSDAKGIGRAAALHIARQQVKAHEKWSRATYTLNHAGNGWSVLVWRIEGYWPSGKPQFAPGGQRYIDIDSRGRVVRYSNGS